MKIRSLFLVISLISFMFSGCSPSVIGPSGGDGARLSITGLGGIVNLPRKAIDALASPLVDLTVADAKSTMSWIDSEIAAGKDWTKNPAQVADAKSCPAAILALSDFYETIMKPAPSGEDKTVKGLIYFATVNKYSAPNGIQEQGKTLALKVVGECGKLVPANKFGPGAIGGLF